MNKVRVIQNLYTIANYDFKKPEILAMGLMCFDSVLKNFAGQVNVLSKSKIDNYFTPYITNKRLVFHVDPSLFDASAYLYKINLKPHAKNNIEYKLFHLCKINQPFVFVDLDTYLFSPFSHLFESLDNSLPFLASIDVSQDGREKSHINSGVLVVNDPKILDWREISNFLINENFQSKIPGSDQVVLHYYFEKIGYDYLSNKLPTSWNANSLFVNLKFENNYWSAAFVDGQKVNLIHYYGYKPQNTLCPLWFSYFKNLRKNLLKTGEVKKFFSYSLIKTEKNDKTLVTLQSKVLSTLIKSKSYLKKIKSIEIDDLTSQSNHKYQLSAASRFERKPAIYLQEDQERLNNQDFIFQEYTNEPESNFHVFNDVIVNSGNLYFKKGKFKFKIGSNFEDKFQNIQSCFLNINFDISTLNVKGQNRIIGREIANYEKEISNLLNLSLAKLSNGYIRNLNFVDDPGFSIAKRERLLHLSTKIKSISLAEKKEKIVFFKFKDDYSLENSQQLIDFASINKIKIVDADNLSISDLVSKIVNVETVIITNHYLSKVVAIAIQKNIIEIIKIDNLDFNIKNYADSLNLNYGFLLQEKESLDLNKLASLLEKIS